MHTRFLMAMIVASALAGLVRFCSAAAPATSAADADLKTQFLALCDTARFTVAEQARKDLRSALPSYKGRAFYWDSYVVRSLCVAFDMTGKPEYLDVCKRWSDRMIDYQKDMVPKGAYYMQYGRKPGEDKGDWYVADCSSIALGVLATAQRVTAPADKARYLDSVKAFAKLVTDNFVRPSGGVTDGYWPKSDKEWWCSTGIFGSLAFFLYDETKDPSYLKVGLAAIDWLNQQDLLTVGDIDSPKQLRPTVLMYCLEGYSAAFPYMKPEEERTKLAMAQWDKAFRWMTENFGGRSGVNYTSQWGSKLGGLPMHLYVYSQYAPQTDVVVRLADGELRYATRSVREAVPNKARDQLALFTMLAYAEKIRPGSIYRMSKR